MTYRLLVCLVLVVATHTSAAATLMYNVHGYTMSGGQRHEFVALEYENGVITSVYENTQSVAASTATIRIDGNGATLLPGLIDAHG
ncbi:MAG: amidohydrolase, partial [Pseudomonadota bacterium]